MDNPIQNIILQEMENLEALQLASQFDLSGGEIENIARRHCVKSILAGTDDIDMASLIKSCKNERINNTGQTRIGF